MLVLPKLSDCTRPVLDTVATVVLLDVHTNFSLGMATA